MNPIRLKTEHLFDPLGIDVQRPRLMWNCEGGVKQRAYEIVTEKWQSGKVESDEMHAIYPLPLTSRELVVWKVRLWDENDVPGDWTEASFEMGLLEKTDWTAQWISGDYRPNKKERYPVDCFSKAFALDRPVAAARLYATACGLYEAKLDGQRVGNFVMAPGYTDYTKRIQYQTYDVTSLLHEGENELTAQLADGWFRGSCGAWGLKNQYGAETKLLLQLEITFADGSRQMIGTDSSWAWSNDGPIRQADNKDGEIVEAFRAPSYRGKAKVTKHSVTPTASNNVPVTEHETFHPVIIAAPNGKKLLDFGQNLAGYVRFALNGRLGQRMVWRFGEMLDEAGNLTQRNIQLSRKGYTTPLQRIDYTCGEGLNEYGPAFAVFGFRYAEVDTDVELDPAVIEAVAVYSDLERTGDFSCSHKLLNQLFDATLWSAKGNHLDIPTDCPTRERHGWTGDAQLFFTTAAYLFDFAPFARKYLHDVFDWQRKNGRLPHIVPEGGADFYMWTMNGSVGWSDVGVLIPWRYADIYQDDAILAEFYDGMAKYARFMESRCGKNMPFFSEHVKLSPEAKRYFVNQGQSYGEWAEPADVDGGFHWQDFVAPHPEVSTAYTCYVLGLMAKIARRLGHEEDAKEFQTYSDGCKTAYRELVETDAYSLDTDRQARLVRPLSFGLLDEAQTAYAKQRLIEALEHYRWRLGTGFLSTPLILYVLADIDPEAAYTLLENEEVPGWLSMPKAGATTIWEAWEGPNSKSGGIGSLNHYSKGAVVEWLFTAMCGIRVAGENRFTVKPLPGGSLTHAQASYTSVFGKISSKWERADGKITYTVDVPANCEAKIVLPSGRTETVDAGLHRYTEG